VLNKKDKKTTHLPKEMSQRELRIWLMSPMISAAWGTLPKLATPTSKWLQATLKKNKSSMLKLLDSDNWHIDYYVSGAGLIMSCIKLNASRNC